MSLSTIKLKILESMFLEDRPARAALIAKDSGNEFRVAMMHLLDLTRKGYVFSPEKGLYAITDKGKKALSPMEITVDKARELVGHLPREKAFHFYTAIEKPLGVYAYGLQDFVDKVQKVDVNSLEFHIYRGDFENWFTCIGDAELGKKMALLKDKNLCGEELRQKLKVLVESRCMALSAMT